MRLFLLSMVLLALLSGCAGLGTTVVDFRVKMEISYRHPDLREAELTAGNVAELPRDPKRTSPFPDLQYRDSLLSWTLSVGTFKINNRIENRSGQPLTLHWQEAVLVSSQQAGDIPLRSDFSNVAGKWLGRKGYVPKHEDRVHALVPLHLPAGQSAEVLFHALYHELFTSGRLFGVRYESSKTRLDEAGIGNWLLIKLPIDYGEQKLVMRIKLTALDAKARISYY